MNKKEMAFLSNLKIGIDEKGNLTTVIWVTPDNNRMQRNTFVYSEKSVNEMSLKDIRAIVMKWYGSHFENYVFYIENTKKEGFEECEAVNMWHYIENELLLKIDMVEQRIFENTIELHADHIRKVCENVELPVSEQIVWQIAEAWVAKNAIFASHSEEVFMPPFATLETIMFFHKKIMRSIQTGKTLDFTENPKQLADVKKDRKLSCASPKRFFGFDLDGTLVFFDKNATIEKVSQKGYFRNLPAMREMVEVARLLYENAEELGVEPYLLTHVFNDDHSKEDKKVWVEKYLPEYKDRIIFVPYGTPKMEVLSNKHENDILVDDNTNVLTTMWHGIGVKVYNGINNTKHTWRGYVVNADSEPICTYNTLKGIVLATN